MHNFLIVEPSVDGEIDSVSDFGLKPQVAQREAKNLEYLIDVWSGNDVITSTPFFLVTRRFARKAEESKLTGAMFTHVVIKKADQFDEWEANKGASLPELLWMRVLGQQGNDDIGLTPQGSLVVSEKCMIVLNALQMDNASIYQWDGKEITHLRKDDEGNFIHVDNSARLVQLAKALATMRQKA
jgi:hypothetical protein